MIIKQNGRLCTAQLLIPQRPHFRSHETGQVQENGQEFLNQDRQRDPALRLQPPCATFNPPT